MGRRAVSAGAQRHGRAGAGNPPPGGLLNQSAGAAVPWAVQPETLRPQKDHIPQTVDEPSCLAW